VLPGQFCETSQETGKDVKQCRGKPKETRKRTWPVPLHLIESHMKFTVIEPGTVL
jgi:hypothetical protein